MSHLNYTYAQVAKWNKNPPPLNEEILLAAIGGDLYLIGIGTVKENSYFISNHKVEWVHKESKTDLNYVGNLVINRWRYIPKLVKIQIPLEL